MYALKLYPWASRIYLLHKSMAMTSSINTISDSVELLILRLYLTGLDYIEPFPRDIVAPVYIFVSS